MLFEADILYTSEKHYYYSLNYCIMHGVCLLLYTHVRNSMKYKDTYIMSLGLSYYFTPINDWQCIELCGYEKSNLEYYD